MTRTIQILALLAGGWLVGCGGYVSAQDDTNANALTAVKACGATGGSGSTLTCGGACPPNQSCMVAVLDPGNGGAKTYTCACWGSGSGSGSGGAGSGSGVTTASYSEE